MEVVQLDSERVASDQIVEERIVSLLLATCVWMSKIDEVGAVRETTFSGVDAMLFTSFDEQPGCFGVKLGVLPFALILEE